ncbi:hypothetical protein [Haematobacter massiliensis]|uniref:hypothetical protein n=1 Tax=Haematobacter massiliensis TaxID=195105 RepID=UPI0023F3546D|nr:hypothetical protein [Haematobacter massiliensis]
MTEEETALHASALRLVGKASAIITALGPEGIDRRAYTQTLIALDDAWTRFHGLRDAIPAGERSSGYTARMALLAADLEELDEMLEAAGMPALAHTS